MAATAVDLTMTYWGIQNSAFSGFVFGLLGPFGPKSASSYHKTMVSEKKLGRNLFCAHWRAAVATGRGRTFSVLWYRILYRGYACMILGIFFLEIFTLFYGRGQINIQDSRFKILKFPPS